MRFVKLYAIALLVVFLSSCAGLKRVKNEYLNESHYQLDSSIFLSYGWGGNSGVIELDSSFVIIDTKMKSKSGKFYQLIKDKIKGKKIYIINTHLHHDHTSGNYLFNADKIFIPNYSDSLWNAMNIKENHTDKLPYKKVTDEVILEDSNNKIRIIPVGTGHTKEDIIVLVENKKLLFSGDLLFNRYHPYLKSASGSDACSWTQILNEISRKYNIEKVVPGHGPLADKKALTQQAAYFKDIFNNYHNKTKLKYIKNKYRHLDNLPTISSFHKTKSFIEKNHSVSSCN